MKIAVATNNYKNVVGHVGRCKGFILYDIRDGEIKERKEIINPFSKGNSGHEHHHSHHHHHHGHGHNHDELYAALEGAEVLLCKQAGWGLINSLNSRGTRVLFTDERYGDDAAVKLAKNELDFTDPAM